MYDEDERHLEACQQGRMEVWWDHAVGSWVGAGAQVTQAPAQCGWWQHLAQTIE